MRPSDWLDADTSHLNGETWVEAEMVNVGLIVLDGRSDIFRKYVGKIIFGGGSGVQTGVWGVSAVEAGLRGFGQLQLDDLPVEGLFNVGRTVWGSGLVDQANQAN